jgi:hypothetical protein
MYIKMKSIWKDEIAVSLQAGGLLFTRRSERRFAEREAAYEKQLLNAKVANLKSYYAGKVIGAINAGYIWYQYDSEQISFSQMSMEEGSNVIATYARGVYGAAWALGWETGRQITLTSGYQEMKFNFWRNRMEGIYGPPSELNRHLWEEFYLEYFKY